MNRKKIYTLIEMSLLFIILVTGCVSQNVTNDNQDSSEETRIVLRFFPTACPRDCY